MDKTAKDCGIIVDVDVSNSGTINNYITSKSMVIKPDNMYFRKDYVYHSPSRVFISNYRPRDKKNDNSKIMVKILDKTDLSTSRFTPSKIQYNPESILGKTAKDDLFGLNNEVIIKTNQTITKRVVDDATKHNRLNQLYFIAN